MNGHEDSLLINARKELGMRTEHITNRMLGKGLELTKRHIEVFKA